MAKVLTQGQKDTIQNWIERADRRLKGAEAAAHRPNPSEGEFDNNFDGVVTAIFHTVDAFELARTGNKRRLNEADQPTVIRSVIANLQAAGIPDVPVAIRLINLNARRNTSIHGDWLEVLDTDALDDAITAARKLLTAVLTYFAKKSIL